MGDCSCQEFGWLLDWLLGWLVVWCNIVGLFIVDLIRLNSHSLEVLLNVHDLLVSRVA